MITLEYMIMPKMRNITRPEKIGPDPRKSKYIEPTSDFILELDIPNI